MCEYWYLALIGVVIGLALAFKGGYHLGDYDARQEWKKEKLEFEYLKRIFKKDIYSPK